MTNTSNQRKVICDNFYYENNKRISFTEPLDVAENFLWLRGDMFLFAMESKKPTGESFQYIDIDSIDNSKNIINRKIIPTDNAPSRASRKVFKESSVFSMVRPYLRNIAFVGSDNADAIASTGFYVCTPMPFVLPKYFFMLLKSDYVVNGLNFFMKGDNSPSINGSNIEAFLFPIPSLSYQQKVLDVYSQVEKLLDVLDENINDLKSYAVSAKHKILDFIFGENSSYKSYYQQMSLKDICELDKGQYSSGRKLPYLEAKVIRGTKEAKIVDSGILVEKGADVILVDGENSGEVMTAPCDGYMGSTFRILKTDHSKIVRDYLLLFLLFNKQLLKDNKKGSAIPHLNKKIFSELKITMPELQTQKAIAKKINYELDLLDLIS